MIQLPCSKFCLVNVCTILLLTCDVVQSAGEVVQEPVLNVTINDIAPAVNFIVFTTRDTFQVEALTVDVMVLEFSLNSRE